MRRAAYAIGIVLAAGVCTRLCGAVFPAQLAMMVAGATVFGIPGWALLRASGLTERLDTVGCLGLVGAAGLAVWAVALAIGVIIGLPFWVLVCAVAIASAAGLALERSNVSAPRLDLGLATAGAVAVAALATRWQWSFYGDELFHAGRIRKLLALDRLSLRGVSSYLDGPPHAGYAFPLLHAAQAAMTWLSGLDAGVAYQNMAPFFAALFLLSTFAAGRALGGTCVGVAAALLAVSSGIPQSEPWLGQLQWPGPFTFSILTTTVVLVVVELIRRPNRALEVALVIVIAEATFVHPTYVIAPLAVVLGACLLCRTGWRAALGSVVVSAAILGWIWWVALRGAHRQPPQSGQWRVPTEADFTFVGRHAVSLSTSNIVHGRAGAVVALAAVLGLLLAWRRRYGLAGAIVAGPLVLLAIPGPMLALNSAIGSNQMHRMWGGVPWPFTVAFALAVVVASTWRWQILGATAIVAAVGLALHAHVSSLVTGQSWLPAMVVAVTLVAIALWFWLRGLRAGTETAPAAGWWPVAIALVIAAAGLASSAHSVSNALAHGYPTPAPRPVPDAVIDVLRPVPAQGHLPVVLAAPDLSYRIVGATPVYVAAVPEVRSRAEPRAHPEARRALVREFLAPQTSDARRLEIARGFEANYVVLTSPHGESAVMRQLAGDPHFSRILDHRSNGNLYTVYALR